MTVTPRVHQVREIVRTHLSGNRLKSFTPLPSPESRAYILHLLHHPFKVVLKIMGDEGTGTSDVEHEVERILKDISGVRVPELIARDDSRALIPSRFYLRAHIPGLQWSDVMSLLPAPDRMSLARRCGEMLGAFHSVEAENYGGIGKGQESSRWSSIILDHAMECLGNVIDKGWIDSGEGGKISRRFLDSQDRLDTGGRPQLTHRRLIPADILVTNEGGEWIATGLLGTGKSAMWSHLWDMASLARQMGENRPDVLAALEESHYGIVSRPDDYDERLELYRVLEALDYLARAGEDEEDVKNLVGRLIRGN